MNYSLIDYVIHVGAVDAKVVVNDIMVDRVKACES